MKNDRALLDAVLREHLPTFVHLVFQIVAPGERFLPNWHIDAICQALMRVASGEIKRLIIEAPPRSLKSICGSVALVAFLLGQNPTRKIICASYSGELAGHLSRQCRKVLRHPLYTPELLVSSSILGATARPCWTQSRQTAAPSFQASTSSARFHPKARLGNYILDVDKRWT